MDGSPGGTGGTGGPVVDASAGAAGSAPDAGGKLCGCKQGYTCGPNEWCDYDAKSYCGVGDACGVCKPRPDPSACPPVPPMGCAGECGCGKPYTTCGCDGQFYCSADCAHLAGSDDNPNCAIDPPSGFCKDIDQALANQVTAPYCASVVRLTFDGMYFKGYAIVCGTAASPDEATARATAQADTGYGQGQLLSGPSPNDEWVFYSAPGDFGGASAVSATSGLSVFGGSIIWMGTGEIDYPTLWNPANQLGACGGITPPNPPSRAIDLSGGEAGGSLPQADLALGAVMQTELPNGLALAGHQIVSAMVLLYPRTVGMFDSSTAEWIVILNSVVLEG
jgi:hypothetical protein